MDWHGTANLTSRVQIYLFFDQNGCFLFFFSCKFCLDLSKCICYWMFFFFFCSAVSQVKFLTAITVIA